MKKIKCPYCNEKIDAGLDVCPICFEKLPQEDSIPNEQTTDSNDKPEKFNGSYKKKNNKSKTITILLSIILILLVGVCSTLCVIYKDEIISFLPGYSYLEKGIKCYNNNDFANAKEFLNKQIQEDNNPKAY